jgi:hypothetical protein
VASLQSVPSHFSQSAEVRYPTDGLSRELPSLDSHSIAQQMYAQPSDYAERFGVRLGNHFEDEICLPVLLPVNARCCLTWRGSVLSARASCWREALIRQWSSGSSWRAVIAVHHSIGWSVGPW